MYKKLASVDQKTTRYQIDSKETATSFVVVATSKNMTSLPSTAVKSLPPKVLNIPGKLEANDVSSLHNIPLYYLPAKDSLPEIYYLFKTNLTYQNKQVDISFEVDVKKNGWYVINYRGRSFVKGLFFTLWSGNELLAKVDFDPERDDKTSQKHIVYLEKGRQTLHLSVLKEMFDRWSLVWLSFTEKEHMSSKANTK